MTSRGKIMLQLALNDNILTASESIDKNIIQTMKNENSNLQMPISSTSSDYSTGKNEVRQEEYDGEDNNYDSSCDTLFGDNSSDEYVPDPEDYINSSSDNEIDNEMVDAQSNNEPMEEENDILMEDNNILVSQAKSNENIVGQNEKEHILPTVHRKKKHFQPKIKVSRKRQRNVDEWKKRNATLCRQREEAYKNYKGELKPAKNIVKGTNLGPEKCRRQCSQVFTIEDREKILSSWYKLDINAKNSFLYNSIKIIPTHRQRNGALKHKTASFQYNVT
ncbi:uncharacterized protein [Diabrotica undecimpunctata]|uniref:uncharacterized protein n=1 Tax=Diabrotica undecimpunctata TaxID=50387 RepID=UPI003B634634